MQEEKDILIHPRRGKKEKPVPETGLLLVNPDEAEKNHLQLRNSGAEPRFLFNSALSVDEKQGFFIAGPSIGAPMAVMTMEKLIALGGKRIILFGWCGAISDTMHVGDVLLPDGAVAGEGTSRYYVGEDEIKPSEKLHSELLRLFEKGPLPVKKGRCWSTDAIYRESRQELVRLRKERGVAAVDMEFSALCSVAVLRKIEFAAVLVVSDELWHTSWKPGFSSGVFKRNCRETVALLIEKFLTGRGVDDAEF
jgi:uridine phosphorylase